MIWVTQLSIIFQHENLSMRYLFIYFSHKAWLLNQCFLFFPAGNLYIWKLFIYFSFFSLHIKHFISEWIVLITVSVFPENLILTKYFISDYILLTVPIVKYVLSVAYQAAVRNMQVAYNTVSATKYLISERLLITVFNFLEKPHSRKQN